MEESQDNQLVLQCTGVEPSSSSPSLSLSLKGRYPIVLNISSNGSVFIRFWLARAKLSTSLARMSVSLPCCGRGLHKRTTGSSPLVAIKHVVGCGCTQLTTASSACHASIKLVVLLSHINIQPQSLPATIN